MNRPYNEYNLSSKIDFKIDEKYKLLYNFTYVNQGVSLCDSLLFPILIEIIMHVG